MGNLFHPRVEKMIERGKKKGTLPYERVDRTLSRCQVTGEERERVFSSLSEAGVRVVRKSATREWVESIVIAFVLAMFIREFFFQAFRIPSGSMRMTLIEGDRLLVNKLVYGPRLRFTHVRLPGYSRPQRGDVIVFIYPEDRKRDFIKRLIAFGGETVEIRGGDVYINGQRIDDPVIKNTFYYNRGPFGKADTPITVPRGSIL